LPELHVVLEGLFEKRRLLDLVRDFIVFEDDRAKLTKKLACYHQFHAVRVAVEETLRSAALQREAEALLEPGRGYHTQTS